MEYQRIYPAKGRISLDGGQNSKFDKHLIADNESPSAANVIFDDIAAETRGGTSKVNTAAVGSFACDGLHTRNANDGSQTMVAFFAGNGHTLVGTSFITIPSALSIFTAGIQVGSAQYENQIFFGNGGANPYKYNGTTFTRHGIPAATTTMAVASNAVGALTGDYRYKMTYVNSGLVESDVSPATATFTAASGQLRVTAIPVAPVSFGVNQRILYRTAAGGSDFKKLTTINDNTTTQYDDNALDATLGAAAPTDQGEPPIYSVIAYHRDRLFMNDASNLNFIWYSELTNPYVVKADSFIRFGDNTSDLVRSISVYGESLVIHGDRWAEIIYMPDTDPDNWQRIRVKQPYGSRSPFGAVMFKNKLMFPALENGVLVGFAAISGTAIAPSVTFLTTSAIASDLESEKIEPEMADIQESQLADIQAIVYKSKIYIAVSHGSSQTTNNRIYVYDFSTNRLDKKQEGSWMPWTGLTPGAFTIYNGLLYYGTSAATGFVYQMNTSTYNDDGAAIDSYIWTKDFQGEKGDELYMKDMRFINVLLERSGVYNVEIRTRTDSDQGIGDQMLVDVSPGGTSWGSSGGMIWGTSTWNAGSGAKEEKLFIGQKRGTRVQFKFSNLNTLNQKFKVLNFNFGYNLKGRR